MPSPDASTTEEVSVCIRREDIVTSVFEEIASGLESLLTVCGDESSVEVNFDLEHDLLLIYFEAKNWNKKIIDSIRADERIDVDTENPDGVMRALISLNIPSKAWQAISLLRSMEESLPIPLPPLVSAVQEACDADNLGDRDM